MQEQEKYKFIVEDEEEGLRLDHFVSQMLPAKSRSYLQKLIKTGDVLVNNGIKKPSYDIKLNDEITICFPLPIKTEIIPENISLKIIYEDKNLLVIDKQAGLVVHPGAGHFNNTLVNALLYYCKENLSGVGGILRPGIVHRLDKDTSGCMVVAKDDFTHNQLSKQFQQRKIIKEYVGLVAGVVKETEGKLDTMIGRHPVNRKKMSVRISDGKEALTKCNVMEKFENATMLLIKIGTGRTHQIRVHMSYIGHPILGDKEYSRRKSIIPDIDIPRQMLHSYKIGFDHPEKKTWMEFKADLPEDMQTLIDFLRKGKNEVQKNIKTR